ncbi:TonB-dependent siderophore receptor (plasmid) [Thioclava litoralis]|uniref:TonB-dependent siderophore receptor n=1 Tax=Thioclava litoralis TaxID=3076557 RepID=A0ABZ1E4E6_9RHOB|nr:TonB-dependent siderophore receptor [Thioclava sp. FTW29]
MASKSRYATGVLASVGAAGLIGTAPSDALAQDTSTTTSNAGAVTLDPIYVEDSSGSNANGAVVEGAGRMLGGSVRDTPQTVSVVSAETMKEQQITTLEEALSNVPGVTLSSGEGRGGLEGDQFKLRGISAAGDIYTDGLRDFGTYAHDTYNTESVAVIQGPTGEAFGVGNLGGVINQQTKKAHLGDANSVSGSVKSGLSTRETLDMNRQLSETSAVRVNIMNQNGDAAGRDNVSVDARGLAVDYGMGLGTSTTWHLGYEYYHGDGTPDQGQPMATGSDGIARPLLEYDIPGYDSSTSYVRDSDKDETRNHTLTSSFETTLSNGVTLTNDTRLKNYNRDFAITSPGSVSAANLALLQAGTNVDMSYGAGGGVAYRQSGWGFENMLAAHAEGELFGMRHKALLGLDLTYQTDRRVRGSTTGRVTQTVIDPSHSGAGVSRSYDYDTASDSTATDIGIVAADRIYIDKQWSVQASARADYFRSTFDGYTIGSSTETNTDTSAGRISPSLSVIWEPNADTMVYATASRSYRPIGTDIAQSSQGTSATVANDAYDPERSDNLEIGGKMDLFDGTLGLTGAAFQIRKKNSFTVNDDGTVSTGFSDAGNAVRIRGVQLGATGQINDDWTVSASYAYLDGEVINGRGIDAATIGNDAPGVSKHNLTLWTAYHFGPEKTHLSGDLSVGGGIKYASAYYVNAANTAEIPETVSLDAAISYTTDSYRIGFNAYNLTDHDNYSAAFNGTRATPTGGRSFGLSFTKNF